MPDDLFGSTLPNTVTYTTQDGRETTVPKRGKHYVQPKGYAGTPGKGPAGETCRTCSHYSPAKLRSGKSFPKCALFAKKTHGRGSDILARSPACEKFEGKPKHHCHATGCEIEVPPKMFMCKAHWFKLPKPMRDAIWDTYRPGQEITKDPSRAYLENARTAIEWLAHREGK